MSSKDFAGNPVTGASAKALDGYETALAQLRCYIGDPVALADQAIAASPGMTMAHALKAWLHLLGTEPEGLGVARDCLAAARALPANARELGHLDAIEAVLAGHWRHAGQVLHDVSAEWPRDTLALQAGHQIDFFTGDSRMLRDRIAGVLPQWSAAMPGYHAVLGMHAFGLEEMGDYAAAEAQGRKCVQAEPRDGWGWHAVAHVLEMQDRAAEGATWLGANSGLWSEESFFAVHNWWHLALFHLDQGHTDEALRIFDGPIHGSRSKVVLDMVDASAMLWRLQLLGVDVGTRWSSVADGWEPLASAGNYAFNDCHALMAFLSAGRQKPVDAVFESLEAAAALGPGDVALFAREVGLPVARGLRAFHRRDWERAVAELRAVRSNAHRFGGSHAQRDLIDLTLIAAANHAGKTALVRTLTQERAARKPRSPWARLPLQHTPLQGKAS
jgi:hypothetical protein